MADSKTAPERGAPRLIIEALTSSLAGRRFAYTTPELRKGVMMGRAADCTVRFDGSADIKVSGHHALIIEIADGIYVRDQGSSNGLYVNGKRVTTEGVKIKDGDEMHLGQEGAVMRLVVPGSEPHAPASPQQNYAPQPQSAGPGQPAPYSPEAPTAPVRAPQVAPPGAPVAMPAGATQSLTRMVDKIGAGVGAGDKTKMLLRAVAHELEARQSKKRGTVIMLVIVLFLMLAGGGGAGVWFYMKDKQERDDAQRIADESAAAKQKEQDDANAKREQQMAEMDKRLSASMTKQEDMAKELRAEQAKRFEEMKKQVGEETTARVKEISDAQFKSLKELSDEQRKEMLARFDEPKGDDVFRNMVDKYNPSVLLIFVQYPLLDENGKAAAVEGGTGTGWVAKVEGNKAWVVTNKHVIKPYVFKADLAVSHAIQNLKPADFDKWAIVCWQPGAKMRQKLGENNLDVAQAWASLPGDKGGKGGLKVAGFADDEFTKFGDNYKEVLQSLKIRTDLPAEMAERIKQAGVHNGESPNDLAVLELELASPTDIGPALPIATEDDLRKLHQMDRVMSLGYPLGLSVIRGTTVTTSPSTGEIRSLQFEVGVIGVSAPVLPGNSGGPLIDSRGHVIGVITRGFDATAGEAISASHPRALVEKIAK